MFQSINYHFRTHRCYPLISMKRKIKQKSGLYAYLDKMKVLEQGTDEDFRRARQEYWRMYKANWVKQMRALKKEYTVCLNQKEVKELCVAARLHRRSCTRYLKEAAFSYMNKRFLFPDEISISTIKQLLAMNYNMLKQLFDENMLPVAAGRQVLEKMNELEHSLLSYLYNPKEIKNDL